MYQQNEFSLLNLFRSGEGKYFLKKTHKNKIILKKY